MGYITVTEMPGTKATKENFQMLYSRYRWASQFVSGKDVLEVACGAGQGLGYLAKKARRVVGGDIDGDIVKCAQNHYQGRVEIFQFDAHKLPFEANSFDVVILFEAIYYLAQPKKFLEECRRVLRKNGLVLVCTVNKDWSGFNPSSFSFKYFSIPELVNLFKEYNFDVEIFGAFPISVDSGKDKIINFVRRTAVVLHLIPKTMKGKEKLKRIFCGKLVTLPAEIEEGMAEYSPPTSIPDVSSNSQYKVLFAVARAQ